MKMGTLKRAVFFAGLMLAGFFVPQYESFAAGPTIITADIMEPTVWTKKGSPYLIMKQINVKAPLIVDPGVIVKFNDRSHSIDDTGSLLVYDEFKAIGTPEEKIIFTSIRDDESGGDSNEDGTRTMPSVYDWNGIWIIKGIHTATMEYVSISYASYGLGYFSYAVDGDPRYHTQLTLRNSKIKNNDVGLTSFGSSPTVIGNTFEGNRRGIEVGHRGYKDVPIISGNSIVNNSIGLYGVSNYTNSAYTVDARNNWWGDPSGPYFKGSSPSVNKNLSGKGNKIIGDGVIFRPWLEGEPSLTDTGCTENCFSNVMFLPGIKASRLYKKGAAGTEDKLWPPNYFGNDLKDLELDESGKSINNVYTRDVLDEVGGMDNIYKSFMGDLASMKEDGTINDFSLFAYDWRQNVEDIARNGTQYEEAMQSATLVLKDLAETSKSKKVTIVAHSNGGLLAKAIMLELESRGLADKVDKLVFVGTPQMGTPLSVLSLLYGYDESALLGTLISRGESRALAENMPGAYGLLPSQKYFDRMENPFINFLSENTRYKDFADHYGSDIGNKDEFYPFLLGSDDGRAKPEESDVESENVLNPQLISQAEQLHEKLDNWTPPEGVEVIQIAGWGLDTVSGVDYKEKEKTHCVAPTGVMPVCAGTGEYEPIYEPKFTVDGDKVVVAPSALMLPEAPNAKRYWVDLKEYNGDNIPDRKHGNILEIDVLRQFISNIILNKQETLPLPEYIKTFRPNDYNGAKPRLRMSLYSPLDIHLYDSAGNHTGPRAVNIDGKEHTIFEENIPNSYYYQFGDRKYVGFPTGERIKVELDGYALGSYTLKLEEVKETTGGEEVVTHTAFENLPTTADTTVKFELPETGLADITPLEADVDGDGKSDYEIEKNSDGTTDVFHAKNLESIPGLIDGYAELGLISDVETKDFLQEKVAELIHVKGMVAKMEGKRKENPKANQLRLFDKKVDDLVNFINGELTGAILSPAKEVLIQSLDYVRM